MKRRARLEVVPERRLQVIPESGASIQDIPLGQLLFDPSQPRKKFTAAKLLELAESIRSTQLQQLPVVNFAFEEDGKRYYYIKAGERRFRAHLILKRETMTCIVERKHYNGVHDIDRILAQAAENSSREPHTHAEIVMVTQQVVRDEIKKKGDKIYGAVELALDRVAKAFGKSRAWAENYYTLTRLHPELVELLDCENDEDRLSLPTALSIARVPAEQQKELLDQGKRLREKGGHALMRSFIAKQAYLLRLNSGVLQRGRKPSDDKANLVRLVRILHRQSAAFIAERHSTEHKLFVKGILEQMGTIEVDGFLADLNQALIAFIELQSAAKARHEELHGRLRAVN